MILLILSGEAIFVLPFVLIRVFRTVYLDVFNLNHTELGICYSIYGVVALVAYLFGGSFADRIQPRYLIAFSLVITAFGGFYLSSIPSFIGLQISYGFWGFSTVFFFWSAMIKATRLWGGKSDQGKAFGFLEAGRGLAAASFGLLGVFIISSLLGELDLNQTQIKVNALRTIILVTSLLVALIGAAVFFFLKFENSNEFTSHNPVKKDYLLVLKETKVWLMMLIVLAGYIGYKITDIIPQFSRDILGFSDIASAKIGTSFLYLRMLVALIFGFLAQRINAIKLISISFVFVCIASIVFSTYDVQLELLIYFFGPLIFLGLGIYAVRTLYFSLFELTGTPLTITGAMIGVISVVGFTPEIFMGPIIGYYLDQYPGIEGYHYLFSFLAIVSLIGTISTVVLYKLNINSVDLPIKNKN